MWETIELRELRVFLTLADELHFRRTAERLELTQSRVSQSLRELELKLGGRLLTRTSRRVSLTSLGEQFLAEAGTAYAQLAEVLERTTNANRGLAGTVRLGLMFPTSGGPHLPELMRRFAEQHPACEVDPIDLSLSDPLGTLRRGELDLIAIRIPLEQPDLIVGPALSREPRVLAVASDHPLAARKQVSLEDVADYEVVSVPSLPEEIVREVVPMRTPAGRPIKRSRHVAQSWIDIVNLVSLGRIVHPTVPSLLTYFNNGSIVPIPISGMAPSCTALVWRRSGTDARSRAFIQLVEELHGSAFEDAGA